MTPNQEFKGTPLFEAEYLRNSRRWRHIYNGILIGTYTPLLSSAVLKDVE